MFFYKRGIYEFKKIIFIELNPNQLLFIPKGLAHGFLSLEEGTILNYKCDNYYNQSSESGFNLLISKVKTYFPLVLGDISMSIKDKSLPDLDNSYIYEEL